MQLYFIQKEGVYAHGVFWIGGDLQEGKHILDECAEDDLDDYHTWCLFAYQFGQQDPQKDAVHEKLFFKRKGRMMRKTS